VSALRDRCIEVTKEYWECRESQSERVAVAQLILQLVKREDLLGWLDSPVAHQREEAEEA
jgi:hypothetical protein